LAAGAPIFLRYDYARTTRAGHGRYDYSPIRGRARYRWRNGAGLAVYIAINLEHFAFGEGLGAELAPAGPQR
jgi:hypothetical protein